MVDRKMYVASVFDTVVAIKSCQDETALFDVLVNAAADYGMSSFGVAGIPLPGEDFRPYFLLNGWDIEWQERYIDGGYVHCDPVIHRCCHSIEPFQWRDATANRKLSAPAQRVMNEAQEFDMFQGFAVPIHGVRGQQAIVTFGTKHYELTPDDEAALHLLAIYSHMKLRDTKRAAGQKGALRDASRITPREKECILWASEGKTNDDIASILSISRRMVEQHLARAGCKLDTCGKTHLVAEAIRHGIIR